MGAKVKTEGRELCIGLLRFPPKLERIYMETDKILLKQLIRLVAETAIRGSRGSEQRDEAIRETFHNCMRERIKRMKETSKKEIAFEMFPRQHDEDLKSFVGAVGSVRWRCSGASGCRWIRC